MSYGTITIPREKYELVRKRAVNEGRSVANYVIHHLISQLEKEDDSDSSRINVNESTKRGLQLE